MARNDIFTLKIVIKIEYTNITKNIFLDLLSPMKAPGKVNRSENNKIGGKREHLHTVISENFSIDEN